MKKAISSILAGVLLSAPIYAEQEKEIVVAEDVTAIEFYEQEPYLLVDYIIVKDFYHDIIPKINAKIKEGYEPQGGLSNDASILYQAMVKYE